MSGSKFTTPAIAAAALIGGGIYMTRGGAKTTGADAAQQLPDKPEPRPDSDEVQRRREHADAKRDMTGGGAGGGAGVGGNAIAMGPEVGAGIKSGTDNPQREAPRPNTSRDNLPAGGVSGGHGGNNSNTASIEMGSTGGRGGGLFSGLFGSSTSQESSGPGSGKGGGGVGGSGKGESGLGAMAQGLAGTGGSKAREQGNSDHDPKNTKIKSHDANSPTNRGGSPFDKHRKDVTAVSKTSEYPGKE